MECSWNWILMIVGGGGGDGDDNDEEVVVVVMMMMMMTMTRTMIMMTMTRPNYNSFASLVCAHKVTVKDSSSEVARILFTSSERVVILASRET
jgi:hypothetical protein